MNLFCAARRALAPLAAAAVLLSMAGCGNELKEQNTQLTQRLETLEMENGRLKRDLESKGTLVKGLEEQLAQAEATLAAVQLGVSDPSDKLYATVKTNHGDIVMELYWKDAPKTVQNFVGLAEGTKTFKDPNTGKDVKRPFYEGLTFHRVMSGFMIQGGDPRGNGTGGPGYTFADEIVDRLTFDTPGLLAMANRGPSTNGSQFFITTGTPTHLNARHTIFGKVVEGMNVVEEISTVKTGPGDRPLEPVVIEKVLIKRVTAS